MWTSISNLINCLFDAWFYLPGCTSCTLLTYSKSIFLSACNGSQELIAQLYNVWRRFLWLKCTILEASKKNKWWYFFPLSEMASRWHNAVAQRHGITFVFVSVLLSPDAPLNRALFSILHVCRQYPSCLAPLPLLSFLCDTCKKLISSNKAWIIFIICDCM